MTGIVYNGDFTKLKCLWDENYSENPHRYTAVLDRCKSLGLIERCVQIESRLAAREEILSKHTAEHVDLLKSTEKYSDEELEQLSSNYDSIYLHPFTYKQSLLAAGSSINLAKAVEEGRVQNGMALVRPPGHHAMKSEYCGYCYFNNVAIATEYLLNKTTIQKILIVDWDIHHGQATQQMFYNDPRVLYFSIHRYEHGTFWPNLRESDFDHVGEGNGIGFNVNVPLNSTAMENKDYMAILHYLLIPLGIEFSPDLIIISSGYDSAIGDPKGEMLVTPACYAHITQKLMSLTNGRIIAILEGGYYLTSLAEAAALTLRALLGDPCPVIEPLQKPCQSVMDTIRNVIHAHKSFWKCFEYSILSSDYIPEIHYNFFDKKPETYQTRNMYPKIDTSHSDAILKKLIAETKLINPQTRMGLVLKKVNHSKNNDIYQYLKTQINKVHNLKERQSTIKELNLFYTTKYITEVLNLQRNNINEETVEIIDDLTENNSVLKNFCSIVGSLLQIIDSILENKIQSGISATLSVTNLDELNNASILNASIISANYAIQKYLLKRVLIIELNENGSLTQFDDQIMVISVQRLLTDSKSVDGNTTKNHVNVSWPKDELNDAEFTTMMQHIILPISYEYNPELIILSTKFCSNFKQNYGIQIAPAMYGQMIQWLSTLANGRLVICEQSVCEDSIYRKKCLLECFRGLLGNPITKLSTKSCYNLKTKNILQNNLKNYANSWKSLQY